MGDAAVQCRGGGGGGGEGGGMRTVECLRGRLLAERVASKAAKEEADHLAKRLDELEKKLSDEVKIRNKAERKLRIAIKKLESLKILDVDISDSSIGSLSSNGIPVDHAPEMNNPGSLSSVDSVSSGPRGEAKGWDGDGDSARDSSAGSCTQVNSGSSQEGSWCSVVSGESRSGHCKEEENRMEPEDAMNCGSVEEGAGDHDSEREHQPVHVASDDGSSKSEDNYRDVDDNRLALVLVDPQLSAEAADQSRTEGNDAQAEKVEDHKEEDEEEENNELAIVLVEPQHPQASAKEPGSRSDVQSVLLALRQVKEQLRYTIERRSELVAHRELCGH